MRPQTPTIAVALACAALAAGCSHDASDAEATARTTTVPLAVTAVAAQIEARVAGYGPDMGDPVKEGDVLVRLDDADLQATLREMQARLAKAQADNARAQVLRTQGIMSAEEAEKMRTEAAVLEAQLDVIKVKIDRTVIRAPLTGAIASRDTAVGAVVKIGQTLYKLVQDDPLKFRTPVPARFAGYLKVGQKIRVSVDAYPDRVFEGEITRINPTSETANRSITIEALVPNSERLLRPGFFAKGDLVYDLHGDAVVVPEHALTTFAGVTKLFVVAGGKAEERVVRTGIAVGDRREIVDGVKEGEAVAISNLDKLEQGAAVTVTQ